MEVVKNKEFEPTELVATLEEFDKVLGLGLINTVSVFENTKFSKEQKDEIINLLNEREEAKSSKNWNISDKIRTELASRGIEIIDTPKGPVPLDKAMN